eukprot:gene10063-13523_t
MSEYHNLDYCDDTDENNSNSESSYNHHHSNALALEIMYEGLEPLADIEHELDNITEKVNKGMVYDEKRLDYLLQLREKHPQYIARMEIEHEDWLESVEQFIYHCQERMRSFVPVEVFSCNKETLFSIGISKEISKRILQKQCLWLVRMSTAEIARLHLYDLLGRYNSAGQNLDIIETAAVFASLPDHFSFDDDGKKKEWRDQMEMNLKKMLSDHENGVLPEHKVRSPAYNGLQYGPIRDSSTVREYRVTATSDGMFKRDKSYMTLCAGITDRNSSKPDTPNSNKITSDFVGRGSYESKTSDNVNDIDDNDDLNF